VRRWPTRGRFSCQVSAFYVFCFHLCCTTHPLCSDDDIGTVAFMLFVDLVQRRAIARRICETPCCSRRGGCLRALCDSSAQETVMGCLEEMRGLTKLQKHEAIFQKILNSTNGVTEGGYLDCQYNLGVGLHRKAYDVCHQCFENAYELGPSQLYKIRGEVKRGKFCCLSCVSKRCDMCDVCCIIGILLC